jgi:hypothetical protein
MSAIRPPDAQPEAVAQGIGQALGSVAEGITAAFKSKTDEKRDQLKYQRDKELARVKAQAEADYRKQTLDETKRYHDMLGKQASERIDKVTPKQGKSLSTRSLSNMPPVPESNDNGSLDFSYPSIKGGGDFTKPLSDQETDNEVEQMEGVGGEGNEAPKLNLGNPPLADLTSPQGMEAAPDLRGEAALSALSSIPWGQVQGEYKSAGGVPNQAYSPQAPSWLRSPKSVTKSLSNLGGVDNVDLPLQDQYFAGMQKALAQTEAPKNNAMEDAIGIDAIYSEQDALALRNYAKAKGIPANLKATENGYEVSWPSQSEIEKYRENLGGKKSAKDKTPKEIFDEEDKMRGDYVSQSKNFQTIQSAWNNLKGKIENPTGASDMSLIFAYMKLLDPTSTIREGEYATASNVGTIPQTFIGKYNKAVEGNGFLDQKVRESFINEAKKMYQSSLSQHKQNTSEVRRIAKSYGLEPDRVIIDLVTKDEADQDKAEMETLGQELNAVADKDRATYPDFQTKRARLKALIAKSKQPNQANTQTPTAPQKPNTTQKGIFSNLALPQIF